MADEAHGHFTPRILSKGYGLKKFKSSGKAISQVSEGLTADEQEKIPGFSKETWDFICSNGRGDKI